MEYTMYKFFITETVAASYYGEVIEEEVHVYLGEALILINKNNGWWGVLPDRSLFLIKEEDLWSLLPGGKEGFHKAFLQR